MSAQSDAVKRWLFANGIKQTMVADATGIDKATISNYLAGRRQLSPDNCKKLADAYGLNLTYLLTGEGSLLPEPDGKRVIHHADNATITQGDTINIVADNAALEAENKRLRQEVEWLRSMLEKSGK